MEANTLKMKVSAALSSLVRSVEEDEGHDKESEDIPVPHNIQCWKHDVQLDEELKVSEVEMGEKSGGSVGEGSDWALRLTQATQELLGNYRIIPERIGSIAVLLKVKLGGEEMGKEVIRRLNRDYEDGRLIIETGGEGDGVANLPGKLLFSLGLATTDNIQRPPLHGVFDAKGRPLTDLCGHVLANVQGRELIRFLGAVPHTDLKNRPVHDLHGRQPSNPNFQIRPTGRVRHVVLEGEQMVFSRAGYPLLGCDGHLLYMQNGQPTLNLDQNGLITSDYKGEVVFDKNGYPLCAKNEQWQDQKGAPIQLFGREGFPLTDTKGRILKMIDERDMVLRDRIGRPTIGLELQTVTDAMGKCIGDKDFSPTMGTCKDASQFQRACVDNLTVQVFDTRGRPLNDPDGRPLFDVRHNILLRLDKSGAPLFNPDRRMFDKEKLPLFAPQIRTAPVLSMSGCVYRLFNSTGRPLTDRNGRPLSSANGQLLVVYDQLGRATSDHNGGPLYDAKGVQMFQKGFDPSTYPVDNGRRFLLSDSRPLVCYDEEGYPLTDPQGYLLLNGDGSGGDLGIIVTPGRGQEYDRYGRPLYDLYGRRIYKNGQIIINIRNESRFETKDNGSVDPEMPIDMEGLRYNGYGAPLEDMYGRSLWDTSTGAPLKSSLGLPLSKSATLLGEPIKVRDVEMDLKIPLTDFLTIMSQSQLVSGSLRAIPTQLAIVQEEWMLKNQSKCKNAENEKQVRAVVRCTTFVNKEELYELLLIKSCALNR